MNMDKKGQKDSQLLYQIISQMHVISMKRIYNEKQIFDIH